MRLDLVSRLVARLRGRLAGGTRAARRPGARFGLELTFDPGPSNQAYATGDNEVPVQEALRRHLRPGATCYDIGANVGFFSVLAAGFVGPTGAVFAFEPVPANASYVRRNTADNGQQHVTVLELAVSDVSGRHELLLARHAGGAVLADVATPPDLDRAITVDVATIDELAGHRLPPPDVVKIDVEGAEINVLRGMARTLRRHRPVVIYEIDDSDRARFTAKAQRCERFLRDHGYEVAALPDSYPDIAWIVGHFVARPAGRADTSR